MPAEVWAAATAGACAAGPAAWAASACPGPPCLPAGLAAPAEVLRLLLGCRRRCCLGPGALPAGSWARPPCRCHQLRRLPQQLGRRPPSRPRWAVPCAAGRACGAMPPGARPPRPPPPEPRHYVDLLRELLHSAAALGRGRRPRRGSERHASRCARLGGAGAANAVRGEPRGAAGIARGRIAARAGRRGACCERIVRWPPRDERARSRFVLRADRYAHSYIVFSRKEGT
jgi:hypothetical protein